MVRLSQQVLFSLDNVSQYFLSPYCEVFIEDDKVCLERADLDRHLVFSSTDNDKLMKLLEKLTVGISYDELSSFLSEELFEENPNDWIACCIQGGVIE